MGRRQIYGDDLNPKIKQLYEEGFSLSRIAIKLKCHPEVIKRKLISMGVEIRNQSEAMKQFHEKRRKNDG